MQTITINVQSQKAVESLFVSTKRVLDFTTTSYKLKPVFIHIIHVKKNTTTSQW